MKKEIKQIPKHKLVPDGTEEKIVFVSIDGKEFDSEEASLKHEAKLLKDKDFDLKYNRSYVEINGTWYDVIVIKELDRITLLEIGAKFRYITSLSSLHIGINLIFTDDTGDHTWQQVLCPNAMIKDMETSIFELKKLIASKEIVPDKRKEWEDNYNQTTSVNGFIPWEDFDKKYAWCDRCKSYQKAGCECYAR